MGIHACSLPLRVFTFDERTRFGIVAREIIKEERRSTLRASQPCRDE
jgi:hypothetical protein